MSTETVPDTFSSTTNGKIDAERLLKQMGNDAAWQLATDLLSICREDLRCRSEG
jgi:hypothetical protein